MGLFETSPLPLVASLEDSEPRRASGGYAGPSDGSSDWKFFAFLALLFGGVGWFAYQGMKQDREHLQSLSPHDRARLLELREKERTKQFYAGSAAAAIDSLTD